MLRLRFKHAARQGGVVLAAYLALVASPRALTQPSPSRCRAADGGPLAVQGVRLVGMGPKLLLSDQSTAQQPVLRWKLRVKGNTAVEFGIVPADCEVRRWW